MHTYFQLRKLMKKRTNGRQLSENCLEAGKSQQEFWISYECDQHSLSLKYVQFNVDLLGTLGSLNTKARVVLHLCRYKCNKCVDTNVIQCIRSRSRLAHANETITYVLKENEYMSMTLMRTSRIILLSFQNNQMKKDQKVLTSRHDT